MKTEDFERLKSKLGDEFTAEYRVEKDKVMVLVKKKDEWKRVFVSHELQNHFCDSLIIKFSTGYVENPNDVARFLTKQLEKYLNNEIE